MKADGSHSKKKIIVGTYMRPNRGSLTLHSNIYSFSVCLKVLLWWEHGEAPEEVPAVCKHAVKMAAV